jgi:hypothetical protein
VINVSAIYTGDSLFLCDTNSFPERHIQSIRTGENGLLLKRKLYSKDYEIVTWYISANHVQYVGLAEKNISLSHQKVTCNCSRHEIAETLITPS